MACREKRGDGVLAALFAGHGGLHRFPRDFRRRRHQGRDLARARAPRRTPRVQFTAQPGRRSGRARFILALRAQTMVRALHAELFSHMFFAPAAGGGGARPASAAPRAHQIGASALQRDEYRERRHGIRREVAVIDGSGNVVKNMGAVLASVGRCPTPIGYAAAAGKPPADVREALHTRTGAGADLALARGAQKKGHADACGARAFPR